MAYKKRLKLKLYKNQFEQKLPEVESNSKFWADSLSDGETVIDTNNAEDSLGESSEDETSEEVKRVKEVIGDASNNDIISAIEKIKMAKETDNSAQGMISKNTDFRQARKEKFLFDSGAQVCIMGEIMAQENRLTIKSLTKPRNVYEASGNRLDIIGTADMWVKIAAIGKMKKLRCLILRGSGVDREILISCKMLKRWNLIHESFPHETVDNFVKRKLKLQKVASVFDKSSISSKDRVNTIPLECQILHKNILKKHAGIFKDKIGKMDRVNIPPVKLQLDETKDIPPTNVGKPFDVPYHLRRPARKEFREMVDAGIVVPNDEPSDWRSQAFPKNETRKCPTKVQVGHRL